jgi:membrane protein implicated in regulation of membrane protease activity
VALLSLLMSGDHDASGDASADADAGGDFHAGDAHVGNAEVGGEFWLLFTSVRFWVFLLLFFGLAGMGLQLAGLPDLVALLVALPFGLLMGSGAAWVFRRLMARPVTSAVSPDELVGLEGKVLLPLASGQAGKIRLELRSGIVDRVALTEGGESITRGERAIVIAVRGDKLFVSKAPTPALGDGRKSNEG